MISRRELFVALVGAVTIPASESQMVTILVKPTVAFGGNATRGLAEWLTPELKPVTVSETKIDVKLVQMMGVCPKCDMGSVDIQTEKCWKCGAIAPGFFREMNPDD